MNWKKIIVYVAIVLGFLVLSYAFVPQVLTGKIVNQSDISGWMGMSQEARTWNAAHPDDPALWSDSMFGGMPTVSYSSPTKGDLTQKLYNLLLTGKRPATYIFISLLGAFLLLLAFGVHPLIAVGGAIAIAFCSYNFQIIQVGHNTKMQAIAFMPWALAAVVYAYRSRKWPAALLGAALFALAVSFQVKANHPQISYYLALIIVAYALGTLIDLLVRRQKVGRFFLVSALLVAFGLVGIGTNATKLIPTWDYTQYSMRGGTSAKAEEASEEGADAGKSSRSKDRKGLDLSYATAWSYGWEELPNLMIPDYNGGASAPLPSDGKTAKALRKYKLTPAHLAYYYGVNSYYGPQPFTAGPMYLGAVSVFLFLLGLFFLKGKERWWILGASLLAILLALGNHFMAFTKLAVAVLPLYNKFRTVSMALVILQVTVPLLGFLALDRIVRGDVPEKDFRRGSLWALGITGGFCLLMTLFPALSGGFLSPGEEQLPKDIAEAVAADRAAMLRSDALVSLLLIAASWGLLWWSAAGGRQVKQNSTVGRRVIAGVAIGVLVLGNLFIVGKRYLNAEHFTTPRLFEGQFAQRPVDKAILADTDQSFRVLDLTVNVWNDSHPSYWHKNVGGYSPAKLQLYQEYIESTLNGEIGQLQAALKGASTVAEAEKALPYLPGLAALNCRYFIVDGGAAPVRNPYARGAAWFEEGEGQIELLSYSPNELRYHYSADESAKAVFSEVYYPGGWTLRVEDTGELLPIALSHGVLRSAVLPAGEHSLVMRFAPDSYRQGQTLSLVCSILTLLLAAGAVAFMIIKRRED
ncbi:MAG: hypothetical protein II891_03920 [Bacteroidales bacterium]|nr:hypothetical protein [Bacteroidales bacterium]